MTLELRIVPMPTAGRIQGTAVSLLRRAKEAAQKGNAIEIDCDSEGAARIRSNLYTSARRALIAGEHVHMKYERAKGIATIWVTA